MLHVGTGLQTCLLGGIPDSPARLGNPQIERGRLAYQWIKAILLGESGHVGEVEALIALRARRA